MDEAGTPARRTIRSYEDIEAFQRAMVLLVTVHRVALSFPAYERFDLSAQVRRASKSIPANIAEGYGKRRSVRHFKLYLENALGSTNEMIVHMQVAKALDYITEEDSDALIADYRIVGKQLTRLIEKWQ